MGERELPPPAHDHSRGDPGLSARIAPGVAALERAAAAHWQAADTMQLGSWLLRADGGFTGRANSALPLGDPGLPLTRAVTFAARPDEAWLARYRYRGAELPAGAVRLLLSAPWQAFASLVADGETAAVGRVSVAAGWAGITAVDVDPRYRRLGLGTVVTRALAAEAARQGMGRIFLQVEQDNLAARALYARCGFAGAHRYHYRVAPGRG